MGMLARNALAMWFDKRLGLASGLANVGMAIAVGGMPALGFWLIEGYGWRGAYAVLGGAVWLMLFPLLIFVFRDRPEEMGLLPDGGEARAVMRRRGTVIGRMNASLNPLPPGSGSWTTRLLSAPLGGGIRYNGPADTLFSFAGQPGEVGNRSSYAA